MLNFTAPKPSVSHHTGQAETEARLKVTDVSWKQLHETRFLSGFTQISAFSQKYVVSSKDLYDSQ